MAGIKIIDLPALGRDLASTDLFELSLAGGTGSRKITGQEILNSAKSGLVPTTRTLTINGTTQDLSADRTFTISTGITIGTTAITSGTVGRVLFEGTGNVVQESANLFWDNTNGRLGIGTSSPLSDIDISKSVGSNGSVWIRARNTNSGGEAAISVTNDLYYAAFELFGSTFGSGISNNALFTTQSGVAYLGFATLGATNIGFRTNGAAIGQERLTIFGSTGNIGVNTTTDAGFRLDVNGTARVQGALTSTSSVNGGFSALFQNTSTGIQASTQVNVSNNTATIGGMATYSSTNNTSYLRSNVVLASYPTASDLILATSFDVASGGTGRILFKTSGYGGLPTSAIFSTGNFAINTTTDAGYKLDVNGTAVFRGATAITGNVTISNASNLSVSNGVIGIDSNVAENNNYGSFNFGVNQTGGYAWMQSYNSRPIVLNSLANNVIIGSTTNVASAKLIVTSTTQGFLPPRMTTTQKNAIATPAAGLMVYDTTLNVISYYNGTMWI